MADDTKGGPRTWGSATRMLMKGESNVTDADVFGGDDPTADPLAPKKKSSGDSSLDYLGHFAGNDVTKEGHNTGAPGGKDKPGKPTIRRFHDAAIAKTGFRKIPGNASSGYVDRKTRAVFDAVDAKLGGTVPKGPIGAPAGFELRRRDRKAKTAAKPATGESRVLRSKRR